jgi:hypothetical protein
MRRVRRRNETCNRAEGFRPTRVGATHLDFNCVPLPCPPLRSPFQQNIRVTRPVRRAKARQVLASQLLEIRKQLHPISMGEPLPILFDGPSATMFFKPERIAPLEGAVNADRIRWHTPAFGASSLYALGLHEAPSFEIRSHRFGCMEPSPQERSFYRHLEIAPIVTSSLRTTERPRNSHVVLRKGNPGR